MGMKLQLDNAILMTGFYGIPGTSKFTKVHAVDAETEMPICGSIINNEMRFQWCANGYVLGWIECKRCINYIRKHKMTV